MIKSNIKKSNKGFTMVETLVAIAILMISIAGPLTIAQKGLTSSIYARDQVTATFLAQDAMEFLKNRRDSNLLNLDPFNLDPWLDGITDGNICSINNPCKVDTISANIPSPCSMSGVDCFLYHDGFGYKTSGTTRSQFKRSFYVVSDNLTDDERKIVVTVSWTTGKVDNAVIIENQIFNGI